MVLVVRERVLTVSRLLQVKTVEEVLVSNNGVILSRILVVSPGGVRRHSLELDSRGLKIIRLRHLVRRRTGRVTHLMTLLIHRREDLREVVRSHS